MLFPRFYFDFVSWSEPIPSTDPVCSPLLELRGARESKVDLDLNLLKNPEEADIIDRRCEVLVLRDIILE